MYKKLTSALAVAAALASMHATAAPSTPSLSWEDQLYSFVDVNIDGQGSYKSLVTRKEQVDIAVKWSAWSGEGGARFCSWR